MRNDVDDGYSLLKRLDESITKVSATQRLHGNRLHEIQQSVDLAAGRLDRMEDNQRLQAARLSRIGEIQTQQGERLGRIGEIQTSRVTRLEAAWRSIQTQQGEPARGRIGRRSRPSRVRSWGASRAGSNGSTATSAASTSASGVWRTLSSRSCELLRGRPAG